MPGQIGNKGGGRKSSYEEFNKANAINKLWEKINNKVMAGSELSEYEEKLVLALLPKTIKTEQDITSNNKALPQPLLYGIFGNNSNKEDSSPDKED